ncbi:calcium uptake protein 2, mitochondrial isoform X3 [Rhinatrema bivittatum]|uniref:calcium uptake protein 2, mitochondrial isoform X3 n=1 Tax=Rhinatrema bivittatum TaxID=194408 RepID=UPI00112C91FA|nr:calcium uptake protein 2, mitochondrial isoform X3 [Rhinatrema bivittatum]
MATWRAAVSGLSRGLSGLRPRGTPATLGAGPPAGVLLLLGSGAVWYGCGRAWKDRRGSAGSGPRFCTVWAQEDDTTDEMAEKQSIRKQRFMKFASLEYEGEYFMTPRDFLFSVMFEHMERKAMPKKLTKKELEATLLQASRAKPGTTLFRDLGDKGLISYTEYLFLLTILTKPQTGFRIAFKMLDTDGNEQVEKKEFFKLQKILGHKDDLDKAAASLIDSQEFVLDDADINTTLLAHFFGRGGQQKLQYSEFHRFMENLQTEVQEMEFIQFSKGLAFMRKEDFAEWLLFYTDEENNEIYWQNLKERIPAGESISLEEFKNFYHFMNNLEDFSITMKMFTVANRAVKLAEFKRAVKVATGQEFQIMYWTRSFKIFDLDGDNCLSHGEFLGVLKNRLHRGLKQVAQQQGVQGYWKCVKRETIKGAKEAWKQTGKSPF